MLVKLLSLSVVMTLLVMSSGMSVWKTNMMGDVTGLHDVSYYLRKCDYFQPEEIDRQAVHLALLKFQHVFGLPVTGTLNEKTLEILRKPECGFADKELIDYLGRSIVGVKVWKTYVTGDITQLREASYYLRKCGYIPLRQIDQPAVILALLKFQHIYHLPLTGRLNEQTLQILKQPGCGVFAKELIPSLDRPTIDMTFPKISIQKDVTNMFDAPYYLKKCGYIPMEEVDPRASTLALMKFQQVFHLPVTGTLNEKTLQVIKKPGCGVTDKDLINSLGKSTLGMDLWKTLMAGDVTHLHEASVYLRKCGYIPMRQIDQPAVMLALLKFQQVYHLPITGTLNDPTLQIMKQPGCGVFAKDLIPSLNRPTIDSFLPKTKLVPDVTNIFDAPYYLKKCGYIQTPEVDPQTIVSALMKIQQVSQLPVTGILDDPTLQILRQPGCGLFVNKPVYPFDWIFPKTRLVPDVTSLLDAPYYLRKCGYMPTGQTDKVAIMSALMKFQQVSHVPITGTLNDQTLQILRQPGCGLFARKLIPSFDMPPMGVLFPKTRFEPVVPNLFDAPYYLRKCGYIQAGKIDHVTVIAALMKFQKKYNLPVTGIPNDQTLQILRQPGCSYFGNNLVPPFGRSRMDMVFPKTPFGPDVTDLFDTPFYLKKCGYMQTGETGKIAIMSALKKFQTTFQLPVTGMLNDLTLQRMKQPGCGFYDKQLVTSLGNKFVKKELTYKIVQYPDDLTRGDVDDIVRRSFKVWSDVTPLKFHTSLTDVADILIKFVAGDRSYSSQYYIPDRPLDYSYFPTMVGDSRFGIGKTWTIATHKGVNFFPSCVHQFGRSLALSHLYVGDDLVKPFYPDYKPQWTVQQDKIDTLQVPYEQPKVISVDACSVKKWDAVVTDVNGNTYFFAGKHYYKLNADYVMARTPRLIKDDWIGLPDNIDAASVFPEGLTIFFKGEKIYLFRGQQPYDKFERTVKFLTPNFPENVDAAFVSPDTRILHVVKGLSYFDLVGETGTLDQTFPGAPTGVDAVLRTQEGNLHLFYGKNYVVFDKGLGRVVPGVKSIGQDYFGCRNSPVDLPAIVDPAYKMSGISV